jgi:hypothetical protein
MSGLLRSYHARPHTKFPTGPLLLSVAAGRAASPSFLDGLRAAEVVAAAERSAEGRCWQVVERLEAEAPAAGQ